MKQPVPKEVADFAKRVLGSDQNRTQPDATPDDDPLQALDINTHEQTVVPLDGGDLQKYENEDEGRIESDPSGPFTRAAKVDPWRRNIPDLGIVEVTDAEKDDFFQAFWAEEPFSARVSIPVGGRDFVVRARAMTTYEREVVYHAVEKLRKEEDASPAYLIEYYQRIAAIVQLREVDGKRWPDFAITSMDMPPEENPIIVTLIAMAKGLLKSMSSSRWRAICRAMRVFEAKLTMLEDALGNQDFTDPAGTD